MKKELFKDNTIIICENNNKISILKELTNTFLNIKFFTKKEFFGEYFFKYDEKTLYYLINKYNYKIDIAKMYLNNLIKINENKTYKSSKLNYLVKLKKELKENNLLIYNNNFIKKLGNYNIIVYDYPYLDNYELDVFNKLKAKIINEDGNNKLDRIYVFSSIEEEINYVCKEIAKLILNNIDINKIKIMGIDEAYYNDLNRISKMYNIPINIPSNNTLINNNTTNEFINNLDNGINNALGSIKGKDSEIVNKLINICNKYVYLKDDNIKKRLIIDELYNTKINNYKYKNYIEILDLNSSIFNGYYIFYMNFNNGCIPSIIKDEEYITDNIKEEVNLKKTSILNKEIKEYEINKLKSITNLIITAKLSDSNGKCYLSSLVDDLNLKIINVSDNILDSYSYLYDEVKLCKCEDNFNKYGILNKEYLIYKNNIKENLYNTYDNKYKQIDKDSLLKYLNNKLNLSYSSLTNYYKCAFRFYIANILKLDRYEDSFEAFIGSIFHDVLEKCFKENTSVEEEIATYIKKSGKTLNLKERFYINKITDDIKFVINILNKQKSYSKINDALYEQYITINKSKDILINFVGFIDKILYKKEDNKTLVSIIDYKTGNVDINLSYIPNGLNMQLPIYLYLVKKSNLFVNPEFVGFYIQYILDKDIVKSDKSYLEQYENNLKLVGYSNSSVHSLSLFDKNYKNSELIKNMKVKNGGDFYSYAKVLSNDQIDKLIEKTEEVIDNAIDKILDADFSINPKKIGYEKEVGCTYCKFKDICFKKNDDYVILEKKDNLDYLEVGG